VEPYRVPVAGELCSAGGLLFGLKRLPTKAGAIAGLLVLQHTPGTGINLRLQKIGAMEILATYLGGRCRNHGSLKLGYCPVGQPQIALNQRLMPS
jgi:hypothetical protein